MDSIDLKAMKCPVCSGEMVHGYVTGKGPSLIWTEKEKTQTIFAGTNLRSKLSWWHAPTVEAMRCETCKIGIFRYGY
jgi:hypothetical protein